MANFLKIKDLCSMRGVQLKEFAKMIGISEVGLHDLFKRNSTKTETLEKIAAALNVPVGFFFDETKTIEEISLIKGGEHNIIGNNNVSVKVHSKSDIPLLEKENEMLKKEIESLHRELKGKDETIRSKDEIIGMLRELAKR